MTDEHETGCCRWHYNQEPLPLWRSLFFKVRNIIQRSNSDKSKALDLAGSSVLEAVHCSHSEWRRWADRNPGDSRAETSPYDAEVLAMVETSYKRATITKKLSKGDLTRLARVWDTNSPYMKCAGVCWRTDPTRQAFDYAWADAAGYDRDLMDTAFAQVVAVQPLIDEIRGTPGAAEECDADGYCETVPTVP